FPDWPAKLNGLAKMRGSLYGGTWQLDIPELKLAGNVKQNKVSVDGQLKGNSYMQWTIPGLHLELGRNKADVKGELGVKDLNLDANIDAPGLDNALPGLGGTAKGLVNIRGTVDAPQVMADITASNLRWQALRVARVLVKGDVKSTDQLAGTMNVRVERLSQPGVNISLATLAAKGSEKQHELELRVQGEPVAGQLKLAGSFDRNEQRWKGTLSDTRFTTPVGLVALNREIALDYRNQEQKISIGPHCWTNPNAELCVPQTIDAGAQGRAVVNLNRFDLAMLKPFMPDTTQASGTFSGKADVSWDATKEGLPQGEVTLSGRNVKVTQVVNDAPLPVAFETLNLNAKLQNNRADLGWLIRLTNNGQFDGQVQVTDPQGRRNLGGNVNIRNFSLAMANAIFTRGEKAAGTLNANLRLGGNLQSPQLFGQMQLNGVDVEGNFMPFDMQPSQLAMNFNGKAKSFLTQAKKIAWQQSNIASRSSASSSQRARSQSSAKSGKASRTSGWPGLKRGRGAAFVRARTLSGGWKHSSPGRRRVVVKTRYVQGAGKNGKSAAHLRYIQRDGTSRDGERGQLYSATEDRADGAAFIERGADDRHQFRFIVSPEDGADLSDLTAYTRDLMAQVETDLGTQLDWVAVNHHNTGHPHVHVIMRGTDELGENLVINGDYLANGIRERASDLTTLELGPVTEIEQSRKLSAEIGQDRFTRIDRAMTEEAEDRFLDLRHEPADHRRQFDRTLRLRRLGKLEKMGLATERATGVWELSERMEQVLRELGERGDIIRNMDKALKADGLERDPMTFQIHDVAPEVPITGRVLDKYLTDELGENLTIVVDGIDGRTHHVAGIDAARIEDARIGSVIEIGPAETASRPSDRTIASISEGGIYRPSRHREQARFEGRVPGGDYEGYVDAHVRRLEALRRPGIVERIDVDQWRIPEDLESRAAAFDAGRNRQASIRVLSIFNLENQIGAEGSTWLDRRLLASDASDLAPAGFGHEVREAMDRRREHHIEQGDATRQQDGRVSYRSNLLATLREREVAHAGAEMAANKTLPFRVATDGETVSGRFTGTVQLSSGKFAVVEKSHEFTLVPWRPVIDRQLGREVMGIVQGGSVSWMLGRQRGLAI
ncbi:DUF3363 domain-containing protein, partial [Salmonella enterica subsp. enterica serovar Enteritidis]|nr:DUF3363 domain-containing protein [Salmonella enterica subsp. enterica serovar Enteritidis]EHT7856463.1 DUF3363 domain-containing protein [Escherichia coli]EIY4157951.1 DUF3363 domain-containing protein [Escherichia coli]